MMLVSFPPQDIPANMLNPIPIEYRIGVSCDGETELSNGLDTFICLTENAISSQKTALKNRISEISNLHDNWDSYGAVAPSNEVIKNTFKFIDAILESGFETIDKDEVTPTPYGSIVFDFSTNKGLVSVEIGLNELGFFTEYTNREDLSSDGIATDFRSIPKELKEALDILYEG